MAAEVYQIDVSVIIINYNSYELTKETITTLKEFSKGFSFEIILIDNNSRDDSFAKLKKDFPEITLIRNSENRGFGKANNQGLKIAKGEFVLFLNNDVVFRENSIKILLDYLRMKNEKILIAPRLLNRDGSVQFSTYSFQTLRLSFTTYFFLYALFPKSKYFNKSYLMNSGVNKITEVETVTGAFMLSKRDYLLELGGFDEDFFFYGEDNDLCKRFRDSGGKIIYYPETVITHLKGGTKKSNWFSEKNATLSMLKLFDKHYSKVGRNLSYLMFFVGNFLRGGLGILSYFVTLRRQYVEDAKNKFKALKIIWSEFWQKS